MIYLWLTPLHLLLELAVLVVCAGLVCCMWWFSARERRERQVELELAEQDPVAWLAAVRAGTVRLYRREQWGNQYPSRARTRITQYHSKQGGFRLWVMTSFTQRNTDWYVSCQLWPPRVLTARVGSQQVSTPRYKLLVRGQQRNLPGPWVLGEALNLPTGRSYLNDDHQERFELALAAHARRTWGQKLRTWVGRFPRISVRLTL